jgi:hypothetical protein
MVGDRQHLNAVVELVEQWKFQQAPTSGRSSGTKAEG